MFHGHPLLDVVGNGDEQREGNVLLLVVFDVGSDELEHPAESNHNIMTSL